MPLDAFAPRFGDFRGNKAMVPWKATSFSGRRCPDDTRRGQIRLAIPDEESKEAVVRGYILCRVRSNWALLLTRLDRSFTSPSEGTCLIVPHFLGTQVDGCKLGGSPEL